jgi:Na+-translocating ferredoxin:NAD+ oxidoreductase subunit G
MRDMIKMVVVLTVLSAFSGGLLAAIRDNTKEQIEVQQLTFVKGPAIKEIFKDAGNDPIADRFKLQDDGQERSFFVGVYDGNPKGVALESYGKGYGGDVGLMVGIDTETDKIIGVSVTTHSETPGLGALAKEDPNFSKQFSGLSLQDTIKVTKDGGQINALSGATITSRAVAGAAASVAEIYNRMKPEIIENAKSIAK